MDVANKDAAEQVLRKAAEAESAGDRDSALRLYEKSNRLFSSPVASGAAERLRRAAAASASGGGGGGGGGGDTPAASPPSAGGGGGSGSSSSGSGGASPAFSPAANPGLRQRAAAAPAGGAAASGGGGGGGGGGGAAYSAEDIALVRRIKAAKDHYSLMGIPRDADDAAIKKAYRDLSRKVHPDKNSAPDAKLAFQKLGNAFACLSDPQQRAGYNPDEVASSGGGGGGGFGGGGYGGGGHRYHHAEVDPEEIFRAFFGGGIPGGGIRFGGPMRAAHQQQARARQQQQQGGGGEGGGLGELLRYLPFLLFLFTAFSNFGFDGSGGGGGAAGGGGGGSSLGPHRTFLTRNECATATRRFCTEHVIQPSRVAHLALDRELAVWMTSQDYQRLQFSPHDFLSMEQQSVAYFRNLVQQECTVQKRCSRMQFYFPRVLKDQASQMGGADEGPGQGGGGGPA
jgi:hypothetical protein